MKAIIDSDVLIDFLQGLPQAEEELSRYTQPLFSMISFIELHCGASDLPEAQAVDTLLDSLTKVELTEKIARRAVELRKTHRLKLPDAVVLASADIEGCILVTRNRRDFPSNDPRVRFPYEI